MMEVFVNETMGPIEYISYVFSFVVLFSSASYARAFFRHTKSPDPMVRNLCCAVTGASLLLFAHTLVWDVGLRTWQLYTFGHFRSQHVGLFTRMQYMAMHFSGYVFVVWRLGEFLRLTIPAKSRKEWPWWKAPFYPARYTFW